MNNRRNKNNKISNKINNKNKKKKMTSVTHNTTTSKYEIFKIEGKPKIIISKEMASIITFLHNKYKAVEWSGPLLYKILEGNISDPANLKIKCDYIHPMDVGSSTFTQVVQDAELFMAMDEKFDISNSDYRIGYCHTHHNMQAFFSGTDMDELHDNVKNHSFYLSLIVNHACSPVAKIVIIGKRKKNINFDTLSYLIDTETEKSIKFSEENYEKEVMCEIECNVEFEADEWFKNYLEELEDKRKATTYNYNNNYNHNTDRSYIGFNQNHSIHNSYGPQFIMSTQFIQEFMVKHIFVKQTYDLPYNKSFLEVSNEFIVWFKKQADKDLEVSFKMYRDCFEEMFEKHCSSWHKPKPTIETKLSALREIVKWYEKFSNSFSPGEKLLKNIYNPLISYYVKKLNDSKTSDENNYQYEREFNFGY